MLIVEYQLSQWNSWQEIQAAMERCFSRYSPLPICIETDLQDKIFRWSFSDDLFEPGNVDQHLNVITAVDSLPFPVEILSIRYPKKMLEEFPGPQGRSIDYPSCSWIYEFSPKSLQKNVEELFHVGKSGVASTIDTSLITSTAQNAFQERMDLLSKGSIPFIPNITAKNSFDLERRLDTAHDHQLFTIHVSASIGFMGLASTAFFTAERKMSFLVSASSFKGRTWSLNFSFSTFLMRLIGAHGVIIDAGLASKSLSNLLLDEDLASVKTTLPLYRVSDLDELSPLAQLREDHLTIVTDLPQTLSEGLRSGSEKITQVMKELFRGKLTPVSRLP